MSYATATDLEARLSDAYAMPANPTKLLEKASELIDYATLGRADLCFNRVPPFVDSKQRQAVINATCDQVEFWLETGEEHDVLGLHGSLMAGRVQAQNLPGYLGPRAARTLETAGLLYQGVDVYTPITERSMNPL